MDPTIKFYRDCTICGTPFVTKYANKMICSWTCKQEHNRQHSREIMRRKRLDKKGGPKPTALSCVVCGFNLTIDRHRENGRLYVLCPNHHAVITRNILTLKQVLEMYKNPQPLLIDFHSDKT